MRCGTGWARAAEGPACYGTNTSIQLTSTRASASVTATAFGGIVTTLTLPAQCLEYGFEPVMTVRVSRSEARGLSLYLMAMSRQAGAMGGNPSARMGIGRMPRQTMQTLCVASLRRA